MENQPLQINDLLFLLLILIVSPLPFIFAFNTLIRPFKIRRLAQKMKWEYSYTADVNDLFGEDERFISPKTGRNVIRGLYKDVTVNIFDVSVGSNSRLIYRDPQGKDVRSSRYTMLFVGQHKYALQHFVTGYYPASKILEQIDLIMYKKATMNNGV